MGVVVYIRWRLRVRFTLSQQVYPPLVSPSHRCNYFAHLSSLTAQQPPVSTPPDDYIPPAAAEMRVDPEWCRAAS